MLGSAYVTNHGRGGALKVRKCLTGDGTCPEVVLYRQKQPPTLKQ